MEFKILFCGRSHKYNKEEIDVVIDAMQTAEPLTQGKHLKAFEKKFGEYIGGKNCFAICNATAAIEMAAQLCQFQEGDEVIIPSHTFTASAYPFLKKGAKIVWADIDYETRVITAEKIKKCITENTRAIVVVHLYGYVADMEPIIALAKEHDLIVIEDAAQSIGCEINGKKAGTFGDFGIFSFHSHKNITTLGEGGMLVVKDERKAKIIPQLRHNGHCAFLFEREDYWIPAMGNVDMPEIDGFQFWPNNYCLGEVECALGAVLLDRLDEINEEKRKRAIKFIDALADYPELEFHRIEDNRHNYHLLAASIQNSKRDEFIRKMAKEKGVQCVIQYCPLNRYDLYKKEGFGKADCPNTDRFYDSMVSFPFHHSLREKDLSYLVESTKEILEELREI
ncbi:MAG: DegT/DnrJ/EryC1/StrS family aminotransferase [Candidatus Omnitrophica bacterium]|nr:DegT/DnrJ/EryC1/StrS family aminotransferase [Candidatus Omnitrophota bacterium]MBU1996618.1 DegT/DnrJ/EryC1/StrS family aminotransferase [Candidatus Omnitrophota bacterium]MBU4333246.1 DegT/DnrJ/EryC1/StrS family aminotransferase [Candidatus Omnitrophota bacterium]